MPINRQLIKQHMHSFHTLTLSLGLLLILSYSLRLCFPCDFLPSFFSVDILHTRHIAPICATCLAHFILLHLVEIRQFGKEWKLWMSDLIYFVPLPLLPLFSQFRPRHSQVENFGPMQFCYRQISLDVYKNWHKILPPPRPSNPGFFRDLFRFLAVE
jgi:hypothetical protein